MKPMNELLADIVAALGGTVTSNTRNGLLDDWLEAVSNPVVALAFASQPQAKTVDEYSLATFSCEVTGGTAPYTYQWKKNGTNVGTNSASLSFTAAATDKNASITVVVTDSLGVAITSASAALSVMRNVITFNGTTQHLSVPPVTLTPVFEIEMDIRFGTTDWGSYISSELRRVEFRNYSNTNTIDIMGSGLIYYLNGVQIINRVTAVPAPQSGYHKVVMKGHNLANDTLSVIMNRSSDLNARASGSIRWIKVWTGGDRNTGTLVRDYRMNDGFANNPVCVNSGTAGASGNGTYIGLTSGSWSREVAS